MIERTHISATALGAIATCCLFMVGCAGVKHAKTAERIPTAVPAEAIVVPEPPQTAAPKAREPVLRPTVVQPVRPAPPAVVAAPVPPAIPKAAAAPAPVAAQPPPAPLDLESLGTRLKQTRAIGVFTKLSLKNQVDDLLAKFRAYHTRQGAATLPELRRSYDMLLLKVLSLLQDSDPPLARDIVRSRAAIWGILADPKKFNEASLMAGVTT